VITADTPYRVALKFERRRAVVASGLTLPQLEMLSQFEDWMLAFTPLQWNLWSQVIQPIGVALGEYRIMEEEPDDEAEPE
jgi:hypothetical protein